MVAPKQKELTQRQIKFCAAYIVSGVAEKAAVEAGYSVKGARTLGPQLLRNTAVQAYLAKRRSAVVKKQDDVQARILAELESMAFANVADLIVIDSDGLPQIDWSRATREQLAAVTGVQTKRTMRYNGKGEHVATENNAGFKLADKQSALKLLGMHHGMFQSEEAKAIADVADRLLSARARVLTITKVEDVETET